jgi:hypothetical protein
MKQNMIGPILLPSLTFANDDAITAALMFQRPKTASIPCPSQEDKDIYKKKHVTDQGTPE